MTRFRLLKSLIHRALEDSEKHKIKSFSAALTYHTIFALLPLFYIAVSIGDFFSRGDIFKRQIVIFIEKYINSGSSELFSSALNQLNTIDSPIFPIIGILILFFGASSLFIYLEKSLEQIFEVDAERKKGLKHFIFRRLVAVLFIVALAIILVFVVVIHIFSSIVLAELISSVFSPPVWIWYISNFISAFLIISILFASIYKILSYSKASWRSCFSGAVFGSFLFLVANILLGIYFQLSSLNLVYGVAGSMLVTLFWLYWSAQIFFFGAEIARQIEKKQP